MGFKSLLCDVESTPIKQAEHFSVLGSALHIGFFIVSSVVIFVLAGVWIDRKLGTTPLFIIGGVVLSMVVSMYEIFRIIRKVSNSTKKQ